MLGEASCDPDDSRYAHVQARKHFGRIAIANSDAGTLAMVEAAVEQAHRATTEFPQYLRR